MNRFAQAEQDQYQMDVRAANIVSVPMLHLHVSDTRYIHAHNYVTSCKTDEHCSGNLLVHVHAHAHA